MMESIENLYGQKKLKKLIENDHYDCYYEGVILNKEKTRKVIQIVINKQAFEDLVNIEGSFVITIFDKKRQFFLYIEAHIQRFSFSIKLVMNKRSFFLQD
ncbi:hypothetical protein ACO1PF_04860 [Alkalibacterium sp. f15]|uniref:hypothetical protein n=1 Tax=Alkalibacterium sp. f15 TaxID=3414029 RepID=UPI003BF8DD0A